MVNEPLIIFHRRLELGFDTVLLAYPLRLWGCTDNAYQMLTVHAPLGIGTFLYPRTANANDVCLVLPEADVTMPK